ncbi:MAG TPA: iron ABC transporter permease [Stellaceae bacterium]|nr:iron ABC transporter permease [Stellaceae bacterium]
MRHTLAGILLALLIAAITVAPVIYVIVASFDVSELGASFHFGLQGWHDIFTSARTLAAIGYSFLLVIRVPIALVVAFAIAWLLVRVRLPGQRFIELAFWFGFLLPVFPMMMGWILLLDAHYGLINLALEKLPFVDGPIFSIYSIPGIIWVHFALTTVPIMVILLTPALRQMDASFEEAAEISGATTLATLRGVTIPLLAPAILTAFVLALIRSLEAFEVERVLGVPVKVDVYATRIYDFVSLEPPLFAQSMALSALFLGLLLALGIVYQAYLARSGQRATLSGRGVRLQPRPRTWRAYVAAAIIMTYLCLSLMLPLIVLMLGSFTKLFGFFFLPDGWTAAHWRDAFADTRFLHAVSTSLGLGFSVALIGTLLFGLLGWVLVRTNVVGRNLIAVMVWLPWAIPGIVLGVSLFSLILATPGLSTLYGTIVPLVLALIIQQMPIGVQMLRTGIAQISSQLEEAATMCGASFATVFRCITLPLVTPTLISVFLLVFAATLKDISTTVLIAAPGIRTMSLLMFDLTLSGQLETAAVIGVVIAVLCLIVTAISFRLGGRMGIRS